MEGRQENLQTFFSQKKVCHPPTQASQPATHPPTHQTFFSDIYFHSSVIIILFIIIGKNRKPTTHMNEININQGRADGTYTNNTIYLIRLIRGICRQLLIYQDNAI